MTTPTENKIAGFKWGKLCDLIKNVRIYELRNDHFIADFHLDSQASTKKFIDIVTEDAQEGISFLPHASESIVRMTIYSMYGDDFNRWMVSKLIKCIEQAMSAYSDITYVVELDVEAVKQAIVYGSYARSMSHESATDMLYFDTVIHHSRMLLVIKSLYGLYELTDHPGHWIFDQKVPDFRHPDYNEKDRSNFRSELRTELDELVVIRRFMAKNPTGDGDMRAEAILDQFIAMTSELLKETANTTHPWANVGSILEEAARYITKAKDEHEYFKYLHDTSIKIEWGFDLIKEYAVTQGAIATSNAVYFNMPDGTLRISKQTFPVDEPYSTRVDVDFFRAPDSKPEFIDEPISSTAEEDNLSKLLHMLRYYDANSYSFTQFTTG